MEYNPRISASQPQLLMAPPEVRPPSPSHRNRTKCPYYSPCCDPVAFAVFRHVVDLKTFVLHHPHLLLNLPSYCSHISFNYQTTKYSYPAAAYSI